MQPGRMSHAKLCQGRHHLVHVLHGFRHRVQEEPPICNSGIIGIWEDPHKTVIVTITGWKSTQCRAGYVCPKQVGGVSKNDALKTFAIVGNARRNVMLVWHEGSRIS